MEDWYDVGNIDSCYQISEEEMQPPCASKDYTTSLTESTISRKWIWVHHITNKGILKQIVTEDQTLKLMWVSRSQHNPLKNLSSG